MEAFVSEKSGDAVPPKPPELKQKLAAKPVTASLPRSFSLLRPTMEPMIDWTGFYQELAQRDFEAAQVLMEIVRRRREDEDDEDVILLTVH